MKLGILNVYILNNDLCCVILLEILISMYKMYFLFLFFCLGCLSNLIIMFFSSIKCEFISKDWFVLDFVKVYVIKKIKSGYKC